MSILTAVIYIVIICGALALLYWAVDALGTPEPVRRVVKVGAVVLAIILIVMIALSMLGMATLPQLT